MRKKDKLYTINRWNMPAFMPEENIFDVGGQRRRPANSQPDQMPAQAPQDTPNAPVQPIGLTGFGGAAANQMMQNFAGSNKAVSNPWSFKEAFSKQGIKDAAGAAGAAAISAGAGLVGGLANSAISGGLESGAGSAISGIGSQVGSAVGSVNPILGGVITVGSGILGGVTNALFGEKVDEAKLKAANESMSSLRSFNGNVGSFDEIKGPEATASVAGTYKGGLFNSSAKRKQKALEEAMIDARQFAGRSIANNVSNLAADQLNDSLANYSAFGGPLDQYNNDMGAIGYGFMSDYLTMKDKQNDIKNKMPGITPMPTLSTFALGGDLQTNGADWTTGLTHINAGGSHEANPNDGVQMGVDPEGTPNLVEEGEVIFNDYVYSDRINVADPELKSRYHVGRKKDITYANLAKKIEKESQERPNDPISQAGLKAAMAELAEAQEAQKAEMEAARAREAFEALSPEEQTAIMQQRAMEEQAMMNQMAQEEALAQQQAMQEQQMMQADGSQAMVGQEPQMQAYGGKLYNGGGGIVRGENGLIDYDKTLIELPEVVAIGKRRKKPVTLVDYASTPEAIRTLTALEEIDRQEKQDDIMDALQEELEQKKIDRELLRRNRIHYYAGGGKLKEKIYKQLGINTDSEFKKWIEQQGSNGKKLSYEGVLKLIEDEDMDTLKTNELFWESLAKDNPALSDAIKRGYDFGAYEAEPNKGLTFDFQHGGWGSEDYDAWNGSTDAAWKEAVEKGLVKKGMKSKEIGDALMQTDAYKRGSDWLKADENNRLNYLQQILNSEAAPEAAKNYARKYVDANGWKQGAAKDYDTIFGTVRSTHPGTYWKTPDEMLRGAESGNFVINDDGTVEAIVGDVPADWTSAGNYTWASPENDYSYNYYKRPVVAAPATETPVDKATTPEETTPVEVAPVRRNEALRYAGLFGPAVGLGLMSAGVGRPDYSGLDAAVASAGNVYLAGMKPIGNYLTYRPMDIWFEQNRLNANSRATDRAILNSGANQGSKMAGLLASGYNDQIASGDLYRKALEYNDAKRKDVAEFNRGTDQFNAEAFNRLSQFNASARNQAAQQRASIALQAAREKMDADAGWYNSLYGNIGSLFKGIGDIGTENYRMNRIAEMAARGDFGSATNSTYGFENVLKPSKKNKAKGGKVNKKKGLTY